MSRDAKLDLAKRQAVGINKAIPMRAVGTAHDVETSKSIRDHAGKFINPVCDVHGKAIKSTVGLKGARDRRPLEGEKPYFNQGKQPEVVTVFRITTLEPGHAKGSNYLNHKGSRATPQERGHMGTFAYKTKAPLYAEPKWVPAGICTLIPRIR